MQTNAFDDPVFDNAVGKFAKSTKLSERRIGKFFQIETAQRTRVSNRPADELWCRAKNGNASFHTWRFPLNGV